MSHIALKLPGMNESPRRHDITIRVVKEAGHQPDPAAFATAGELAAARNASVISALTAEEIICVVSVTAAADSPDAVAVALAIVAGALRAGDRMPSSIR
jgi:hypothetical protein